MMRRTISALFLLATAFPASAQMPPSIRKPIDAAKRAANRTNNQINNEQKAGNGGNATSAAPVATAATSVAPAEKAATTAAPPQARGTVAQRGTKGSVTFYRETFYYNDNGRRDPFLSLMATGDLRPMISDLTLVGIIYDQSGRNSVAVLVDASAGGQTYRKKVGDVLGRMKLTKITEKDITLNVDEFGFARQETLLIDRKPRTGARRPQ
ncbi:MAG TPA: hypothetical protein VF368_11250 [Gemmatimonadaceae bacterium]